MSMTKPDSTAFSLNIKNFGSLPRDLQPQWSMQFLRSGKYSVPFPKRLIIELLNTCNYDCPMCRVGRHGVNLNRKLPLITFKEMISELREDLKLVRLNGLGESTLLPDFKEYIDVLVKNGITIELISNGSGIVDYYEQILRNNGIVLISWDAAEKNKFETLRRPAKWEESVGQLINIANIAKEYNCQDRLFILFTLQSSNVDQLPLLVSKSADWNIKNIIVNVIKLPDNGILKRHLKEIILSFEQSIGIAQKNNISLMLPDQICGYHFNKIKTLSTSSSGCQMPWEEAVIRWNGDVQVCNMFNPYTYGNIYLNSFKNIWNNAFAQVFRDNVNTGHRHPYCKDCVYMRDAYANRSI